jgi:hypothetical protein
MFFDVNKMITQEKKMIFQLFGMFLHRYYTGTSNPLPQIGPQSLAQCHQKQNLHHQQLLVRSFSVIAH